MIHTWSLLGSNSSCINTQGSDLHGTHRLCGAEMARQSVGGTVPDAEKASHRKVIPLREVGTN